MIEIKNLLDTSKTIAKEIFENKTYPFEVLPEIGKFILELQGKLDKNDFNITNGNVYIHKSVKVYETANIFGPCIIDEGTEVRPGAFIRGNAIVGKNCVVGNSTELKNVIIFDNVQVPHYNYVGDSVLGFKSHMGAGSITSNVKSDKTLIKVHDGEKVIETGLKKMGAVLGDNVEVGCNSVLNPGTVVGRKSNIYPLSSVRGTVPANSIFKAQGNIVEKY